jgi:hypothetical protein
MTSPDPTLPKSALPLHGPTTATSVLVGATCLAGVLDAWSAWYRHEVGTEYAAGTPGIWVADLTSADGMGQSIGLLYVIAMVASGVSLLVWQNRVRANARLRGAPLPHLGLVVAAWYATTLVALVLTYELRGAATTDDLATLAVAATVSVALQCLAGAGLVARVRRVTRDRTAPRNT